MQTFTDHLFTTSTFNKPLVIKDKDAILTLVCRLILLEPGTISIAPEAGVGLVSKYRYMNSETIVDLEENIEEQINRFLPYFTQVDVNISLQENGSLSPLFHLVPYMPLFVFVLNQLFLSHFE